MVHTPSTSSMSEEVKYLTRPDLLVGSAGTGRGRGPDREGGRRFERHPGRHLGWRRTWQFLGGRPDSRRQAGCGRARVGSWGLRQRKWRGTHGPIRNLVGVGRIRTVPDRNVQRRPRRGIVPGHLERQYADAALRQLDLRPNRLVHAERLPGEQRFPYL